MTKRELSTRVCNVRKPTRRISIWVNFEKLLFATGTPSIRHEDLLGNRLDALNAHSLLPFTLKALLYELFSLVHLGGRLERLNIGNNILMNPMAMTRNWGKWTCPVRRRDHVGSKGRNHGSRGEKKVDEGARGYQLDAAPRHQENLDLEEEEDFSKTDSSSDSWDRKSTIKGRT